MSLTKKFFIFSLIIFLLMILFSGSALAAKMRLQRGGKETSVRRTYTRGVKASVRFKPDRRGLLINFSGFGNAVSATYTLTYTANGIPQGATGTAIPATAGEQRELLFGTCSAGVCRYHSNIKNAHLVIESKLNSGLIIRKPYRIKV